MIVNTGGRTDTVQYYTYWLLNRFSEDQGLEYVTNDDSMSRPFDTLRLLSTTSTTNG